MSTVIVRMFATLRDVSGSETVVVEASSLFEIDRLLRERFGDAMGSLLGSANAPLEGVVVLLNGITLTGDELSKVSLNDGDEVAIFPPISGG